MKNKKHPKSNLLRLMEYVTLRHKGAVLMVAVSILVSVAAGLVGNMFVQVIIDD